MLPETALNWSAFEGLYLITLHFSLKCEGSAPVISKSYSYTHFQTLFDSGVKLFWMIWMSLQLAITYYRITNSKRYSRSMGRGGCFDLSLLLYIDILPGMFLFFQIRLVPFYIHLKKSNPLEHRALTGVYTGVAACNEFSTTHENWPLNAARHRTQDSRQLP